MTTQTLTLPDFLLARFAEDEAVARAAQVPVDPRWPDEPWLCAWTNDADGIARTGWDHLQRFSPARVLADCEAKRRIVAEHGWEYADPYESWKDDGYRAKWGDDRDKRHCTRCGGTQSHPNLGITAASVSWPCLTLRALAPPYADHPDYRQEWKP
jgi:hypothetical protein